MLITCVERQCEQAFRPPFEAVLAAIAGLDGRVAVPGKYVHHFLEQVLLWNRFGTGRQVEHENGYKIAAALEMDDPTINAIAGPIGGGNGEQINPEILGDGHALVSRPCRIRVE